MLIISSLEGCGLPDGQGLELVVRFRDETLLNWTVSVVNDGNRALGPIRLMDNSPRDPDISAPRPGQRSQRPAGWRMQPTPTGHSLIFQLEGRSPST